MKNLITTLILGIISFTGATAQTLEDFIATTSPIGVAVAEITPSRIFLFNSGATRIDGLKAVFKSPQGETLSVEVKKKVPCMSPLISSRGYAPESVLIRLEVLRCGEWKTITAKELNAVTIPKTFGL